MMLVGPGLRLVVHSLSSRPPTVVSDSICSRQRAHWYPYFDDMEAIIFLAPISSFDERLREDRRVNRLEDTYMLWQTLCSLQMLSKTQIILFLNKCDLLERKLRAGVRVRTHVPSFGSRSNDVDTVKKGIERFSSFPVACLGLPRLTFLLL